MWKKIISLTFIFKFYHIFILFYLLIIAFNTEITVYFITNMIELDKFMINIYIPPSNTFYIKTIFINVSFISLKYIQNKNHSYNTLPIL